MRIAPSVGRTSPGNRASNRAVFALSRTFRQTVRPMLRSCAFQTFDMLPGPRCVIKSKRFEISVFGIFFFGSDVNSFLKKEETFIYVLRALTQPGSPLPPFAIVNDSRHLGSEVLSFDDAIDEPVLQEEFAALKTLWK